jgi:hypothetical protein
MADLDDALETEDPRKAVVMSGVAHIVRQLLATTYGYCSGPPSTARIEAELGNQLIETSRLLRRYGSHVARGSVGNLGARRQ